MTSGQTMLSPPAPNAAMSGAGRGGMPPGQQGVPGGPGGPVRPPGPGQMYPEGVSMVSGGSQQYPPQGAMMQPGMYYPGQPRPPGMPPYGAMRAQQAMGRGGPMMMNGGVPPQGGPMRGGQQRPGPPGGVWGFRFEFAWLGC